MCWQCDAVNEIDEILAIVIKADKWGLIVDKLNMMLLETWDEQTKDAIKESIDLFNVTEGGIKEKESDEILEILQLRLGENLTNKIRQSITPFHLKTYKTGLKDINTQFAFNKTSKEVLKWAEDNHSYWIGNYYKDQLSEKLGRDFKEIFQSVIVEGMSREQVGKFLKKELGDLFNKPENFRGKIENYFEGFSNHVVTQIREFAHIDGYERAGITKVKISAILDARTSEICKFMHGQIIDISKMKDQRDKIMNAKTPEDAKKYSPWYTNTEVGEKLKSRNKLPKYLGLPPYHFFCRTTTIPAD